MMYVLSEILFLQFVYFIQDLRYFTIIIVIQEPMRQRKGKAIVGSRCEFQLINSYCQLIEKN